MNADKSGDNTFTEFRREGDVAIYHRTDKDGRTKGYEVFVVKVVKQGAALPNGKTVEEAYEQYPGANAFGKHAYDCKSVEHAERRFDELKVKLAQSTVVNVTEGDEPSISKKVQRAKQNLVDNLSVPGGNFTMKSLIESTGMTQPQLYPVVKQWIAENKIAIVGNIKAAGGRGRPSLVYCAN